MVEETSSSNNIEISSESVNGAGAVAGNEGFSNHPHLAAEVNDASSSSSSATGSNLIGKFDKSRQEMIDSFRGLASRVSGSASGVASRLREVPASSRVLANRVDTHARANPWLHIGLAGVGALAIGFLVGRSFSKSSVALGEGYDFDQATDE